jgi:WD40 repeat protein
MMAMPSVPYITLYDLTTGQSTTISALAYSGVVSPDNKLLATSDNQQVYLWDAATLTQLAVLNTQLMPVVNSGANAPAALAFSPDGSLLAVGGETGTVQLWNITTRTLQATLTVFQPGQATVLAVAFSPDGKLLAATGGFLSQMSPSTVNSISVFDLVTNNKLIELNGHTNIVSSLAFSPDGTLILSAGDTTLRAWGVQ